MTDDRKPRRTRGDEKKKDTDVKLGDKISFEKDGVIHTEAVESVRYDDGSPAIYRSLNRWQRIMRKLTPPRWRKSLLVREAKAPSVTVNGNSQDPVGKTLAQLEQMKAAFDKLL